MEKVFLLSGAYPPQTGGELYNYQLSQYLESVGIEQEYVNLHKLRHYFRLAWLPGIGTFLASVIIAGFVYRYRGILVEDHYFSKFLLVTNLIQRWLRKGQIIVLVHLFYKYDSQDKNWFRKFWYQTQEKIRLSFADAIITTSEYSKQEIVSLGINSDLVYVINPGLDREKYAISKYVNREDKQRKILCVANYTPRKGLSYLIEAFSQIESHNFTLHLVGNSKNSNYLKQLQQKVQALNLHKIVYFHQDSNQAEIKYLYANSDIFILPSQKETFGIVFLEAMHYSLPIITTNVSAMPELVTDGDNGLLVNVADTESLAQAMSKLINNADLRINMGNNGNKKLKKSYYWQQTGAHFLGVIKSL